MDSKFVISALIEKLRNESTIIPQYPMLQTQVRIAVNNLLLLKQRLKDAEENESSSSSGHSMNDQRMACLLQQVYSAEDGADTLLTREAFQIKGTKSNSSKKKFLQWPCFSYNLETKTFEDEFREYLTSYDRLLDLTSDIKQAVGDNVASTRLSFRDDHIDHQSQQRRWGRISEFCSKEETDVVGLEEQINELEKLTLPSTDSNLIVVVGEGGSGKTTLVTTVYKKFLAAQRHQITCSSVWVNVPSLFRARYVFGDILKQIQGKKFRVHATTSEEELIEKIAQKLVPWKIMVIENVESPQVLKALQNVLKIAEIGKVIITTRNEDVASFAARYTNEDVEALAARCSNEDVPKFAVGYTLHVRKLNDKESWELFLKKVQIEEDVLNNNSELMKLKDQILKLCGGIPLRIVLLGGLLSTKELVFHEWSTVIERAKTGDILTLSYQDLPSQVKPCFLYMGCFPRKFEIPVRRLIHLWISEGFVTALDSVAEAMPEDLAEIYFEELVIRNMIQVRWRLDGSPKTCHMPGVLYDIFSRKAADVGFFCHQLHSSDVSAKQTQFAVRRLAARLGLRNKLNSSSLCVEQLHSLVAFDTRIPGRPATEIVMFLEKISTKRGFGLLKMLDLEGVYKPVISDDAIGKLLLLSYLGLRSTAIDFLPSSVGNLPCLETLDVKHTIIHDLPISAWKAKKLRHMYLNWSCFSNFNRSLLPSGPPSNLHTLWGLTIGSEAKVDFLKMLIGLRKLGLTCGLSTGEATAQWVSQLTKLESLKLRSIMNGSRPISSFLTLPNMANHLKLQKLYLLGDIKGRSLSDVVFPPDLRILTLSQSGLDDDPMPVLGKLPHLNILRLFAFSYRVSEIKCQAGGFPKLQVLKLWKLNLKKCTLEEGAMPCLRELEIKNCKYLETLEDHLTTLKQLTLINTPSVYPRDITNLYIKHIKWTDTDD